MCGGPIASWALGHEEGSRLVSRARCLDNVWTAGYHSTSESMLCSSDSLNSHLGVLE